MDSNFDYDVCTSSIEKKSLQMDISETDDDDFRFPRRKMMLGNKGSWNVQLARDYKVLDRNGGTVIDMVKMV